MLTLGLPVTLYQQQRSTGNGVKEGEEGRPGLVISNKILISPLLRSKSRGRDLKKAERKKKKRKKRKNAKGS